MPDELPHGPSCRAVDAPLRGVELLPTSYGECRDVGFMPLPVDRGDRLPEGHQTYLIRDMVRELDLSPVPFASLRLRSPPNTGAECPKLSDRCSFRRDARARSSGRPLRGPGTCEDDAAGGSCTARWPGLSLPLSRAKADGPVGFSISGRRRRPFHAAAQRMLQSNQAPPKDRVFQTLPNLPLAVIG